MSKKWNEYIQLVADLLEKRENYQKTLGQVSSTVTELYGAHALRAFCEDLKETGLSISLQSLQHYRWTYDRTFDLNLPQDISYHVMSQIARTKDPQKWANLINDSGWSGPQVAREIKKELGGIKPKIVTCPSCKTEFDLNAQKA